jgi:gamma-glutamylcyclotransferase (GGCT)/AIG2-like uncharacterized protein YtfP
MTKERSLEIEHNLYNILFDNKPEHPEMTEDEKEEVYAELRTMNSWQCFIDALRQLRKKQ